MNNYWTGTLILSAFFFMAGYLLGVDTYTQTRKDAVEHGCASFNQTTGKFEWKNEVSK